MYCFVREINVVALIPLEKTGITFQSLPESCLIMINFFSFSRVLIEITLKNVVSFFHHWFLKFRYHVNGHFLLLIQVYWTCFYWIRKLILSFSNLFESNKSFGEPWNEFLAMPLQTTRILIIKAVDPQLEMVCCDSEYVSDDLTTNWYMYWFRFNSL